MNVKLVIMTSDDGPKTVGVIEGYGGPIPRAGEYIFHPPLEDDGFQDLTMAGFGGAAGVMSVKSVTYGILARPFNGEKHFTGRPAPVVEIWV